MIIEIANFLLFFTLSAYSSLYPPSNKYVEYTPGNTNLIFTVPHDGSINITSIPIRQDGCKDSSGVCHYPAREDCPAKNVCKADIVADFNAKVITQTVFDTYVKNTGRTPHFIINHLHRSMLDPNRPIERAAQGNDEAIATYEAFHGLIEHAHDALEGGIGLHIDFHGYTDIYRQNSTMVGCLFSKHQLNTGDIDPDKSSIRALVKRTRIPPQQFLYGELSLGSMIERQGYRAVPSHRQPYPGEDKFYKGGWITQVHGSRDGGLIDAIQLEFPTEIRTEATDEERRVFGVKLAETIEKFQALFYS